MSTTTFPAALTTLADVAALEGRKVTLEYDYEAKTSRHKWAPTVTRTARTTGTIERDDRVPSLERYLMVRRSQANVIVLSTGYRVVKVHDAA